MGAQKQARKTRRQLIAEKEAIARRRVEKANSLPNPLENFTSFHEYNQTIKLSCMKASDASPECISWIFDIMERNMKKLYEQSTWGWSASEKHEELTEPGAMYLVATENDKFVGFSHFRFDIDDKEEVLYCYELQLEPFARRKGLGRFMMSALETMAFQNEMQKVILTAFISNPSAVEFFVALGYRLDRTSPPKSEQLHYVILSKQNPHQ